MISSFSQLFFLFYDFKAVAGKKYWRLPLILANRGFVGVFLYRIERFIFLLVGKYYFVIRLLIYPIIILLQWYSNCDIHYMAQIGKGLKILHPGLGIVISGKAQIGANLTLVGGNCIGIAAKKSSAFILGSQIEMGVNSTIIGPIQLGNNIKIGANACVVKSFVKDNLVLVGVPAVPLNEGSDN